VTPASDPPGYEYTSADCDVGATESYLLLSWNALIVSGTGAKYTDPLKGTGEV
jgi:hypothetical protein